MIDGDNGLVSAAEAVTDINTNIIVLRLKADTLESALKLAEANVATASSPELQ